MNHLYVEKNDGIALLTINRPKALNALNSEVLSELANVLLDLELDAEVKVVILTGAGEKAFVAGADIAEMAQIDPPAASEFSRKGQQTMLFIEQMKKPVIAAVNGFALGGGLELAMACDFIYASERAKLGLPEVTLGVMPGFGGTQNLARAIGPKRASEMIFTGKMVSAQKLMDWGLINEVLPANELLPKVTEVAALIANAGSLGVAAAKDALVNGLNMGKVEGFKYESTLFGNLFATQDQQEGINAFLEKRKPVFCA
ncbi:enoyl-CoA hydratase/isomerase family protein [bacterium]|nr:enoyl-CoA hydratase/isomerase family protein [bacterium]